MPDNKLYYGDNLEVLRDHVVNNSVDLIYLDPPFNSNVDYNVLFREASGASSYAQIKAFTDTWEWKTSGAEATYNELVTATTPKISETIQALRKLVGTNDLMAYLVMMAIRLIELHRVLKPTGSLYLHCDPTASHYLKVVLDAIFGPLNFRNEIIWKRTSAHSSANRYGPVHDVLLFYGKTADVTWNGGFHDVDPAKKQHHAAGVDPDGRSWFTEDLTGAGTTKGPSGTPWKGFDPNTFGRHWRRVPVDLERLDAQGEIYWPKQIGKWPKLKVYKEPHGNKLQDVWTDIGPINMSAKERLGYPTQKPVALLERLIASSSNAGDLVLDPFCGCGTAVVAAQKLGRKWIGIDITHLAVALMKFRLNDTFPGKVAFDVVGEPVDNESARALAAADRYQFQYWALSLVAARPEAKDEKKGADRGIDGVIYLLEGRGAVRPIIIQVKSGHVSAPQIRDLVGVMEREKAAMGLFISLDPWTKPMEVEAAKAGFYKFPLNGKDYPRVQIRTVEQLLLGKGFEIPPRPVQFRQAERHVEETENVPLFGGDHEVEDAR